MLNYIQSHLTAIVSGLVIPFAGYLLRLHIKVRDHTRAINRLNHDLADHKKCFEVEIHEIKETSISTNKEILQRLDKMTDKIILIGEDMAGIKGYIDGQRSQNK